MQIFSIWLNRLFKLKLNATQAVTHLQTFSQRKFMSGLAKVYNILTLNLNILLKELCS